MNIFMDKYVCVYSFMHTYVYIYIYIDMHTFAHIIFAYIDVCTYICVFAYI